MLGQPKRFEGAALGPAKTEARANGVERARKRQKARGKRGEARGKSGAWPQGCRMEVKVRYL